jgi:hypothetical protein
MTDDLFYSPAPVFEVDGEVRGALARDLLRLEVGEGTDGLKTLSARFLAVGPESVAGAQELLYLDGRILDFGRALRVSVGPAGASRAVFEGRISALEACFEEGREPEVVVLAEDRLMDLRMTRRSRTYEAMSDADIAEAIAAEHGLSAEVDADGPSYAVVQQWNLSDLAFLRERGRLIQAEVWCHGETLYFQQRERRSAPSLTLVNGNHLIAVQVRADLAHQRTAVRVSGYDAAQRAVIDEQAGAEALAGEAIGGRSGPQVLALALGERVSHRAREVPLVPAEAADWARAEMRRRARGFVTATAVTRGTPDLVVGGPLTLERVGRPFSGDGYRVTSVRHTYDLEQGLRTRFEAQRPMINP